MIINHSRAKLVNTNDTNKSPGSAAKNTTEERKSLTSSSFCLILSHSYRGHGLSMLGCGSMSQTSVRFIDCSTPRYHSDSSSTKALCPSQIIRSKELLSGEEVSSDSTVSHIPPISPFVCSPPPCLLWETKAFCYPHSLL